MESKINVSGVSENLANSIDKDILVKTAALPEQELLRKLKIGISISDSPDLLKLGYSRMHLQDVSVEFVRYLLVHGATIVCGGDVRKEGFTYLFSELAKLYSCKENYEEFRFKNYFPWPAHLKLNKSDELDFKQNKVEIIKLQAPESVQVDASVFLSPDRIEARTIWAKSLTYMREQMNAVIDARILLGGQEQGFKGQYPGIIEEAYYALKDNKPVYIIGAYGGASKELANLLSKQAPEVLVQDYQTSDSSYKEFFTHWNASEANKIDYSELAAFFQNFGLEKLSKTNGLSEEENLRLFTTDNLKEMIFYVLKGLTTIF